MIIQTAREQPHKHILGIYRFAWCKKCAAKTCHTFRGDHSWACDICGTERVDRKLWVPRPRMEIRTW